LGEESPTVINYAWHVHDSNFDIKNSVYGEALLQLRKAAESIQESDYLVVDVFLRKNALHEIVNLMLRSTIWFDSLNGISVASHHDDGLVFPVFQQLSQVSRFSIQWHNYN